VRDDSRKPLNDRVTVIIWVAARDDNGTETLFVQPFTVKRRGFCQEKKNQINIYRNRNKCTDIKHTLPKVDKTTMCDVIKISNLFVFITHATAFRLVNIKGGRRFVLGNRPLDEKYGPRLLELTIQSIADIFILYIYTYSFV